MFEPELWIARVDGRLEIVELVTSFGVKPFVRFMGSDETVDYDYDGESDAYTKLIRRLDLESLAIQVEETN